MKSAIKVEFKLNGHNHSTIYPIGFGIERSKIDLKTEYPSAEIVAVYVYQYPSFTKKKGK